MTYNKKKDSEMFKTYRKGDVREITWRGSVEHIKKADTKSL